ncbi:MAG TPA: TetR/AcrR family transcriptional regulator [Gammaproteobacteria bacterium]|nr:TetR/AcrR family transcriptional regulator [Gammaproteobacteria bacterium]
MSAAIASGKRIKQKRSQKTYDALIETCFAMLEQRELSEISIAELARKAGYSVGAFYARFESKDELFDAMLVRHMEQRRAVRARQFATEPDESLVREIIQETVRYFWTRRRFWRAALIRSIGDAEFWEPIRGMSHELQDAFIARVSARAQRPLTQSEQTNVRFAVQLVLGTVNNTIINRPGPIFMGQASFVDGLVRAFKLVSGYDEVVAAPAAPKAPKKRGEAR